MCCSDDIVLNLCELYPNTHEALKRIAIQKRELYLGFLNAARDLNSSRSGVPHGIDSRNALFKQKQNRVVIQLSDLDSKEKRSNLDEALSYRCNVSSRASSKPGSVEVKKDDTINLMNEDGKK